MDLSDSYHSLMITKGTTAFMTHAAIPSKIKVLISISKNYGTLLK
jgi:hypothetical protein